MKNVLKYEDLIKIEEFLRDNEYDNGNIRIVMNIETQKRLDRINNDYSRRFDNVETVGLEEEGVDEVNVEIGRVLFTYQLKPEENEDN